MPTATTISHSLHWFRYATFKPIDHVLSRISSEQNDFSEPLRSPAFNQPFCHLHTTGLRVYFGSPREAQPIVVEVPGQACEVIPIPTLTATCRDLDGSPTRLDAAGDVGPPEQATRRLKRMRATFRKGECKTNIPTRSTTWIESDREGEGRTLYIGSSKQPTHLRAYDRRSFLRLEWQLAPQNKRTRRDLLDLIDKHGIAAIWRGAAHKCIWPDKWYRDCLAGDAVELEPKPVVASDLTSFVEAIMAQYGDKLYLLELLGFKLSDLSRRADYPTSFQLSARKKWADQATKLGYDVAALQREITQCRKPTK
jgi:hypothetical protein